MGKGKGKALRPEKGKGKSPPPRKGKREKAAAPKRENPARRILPGFHSTNHRAHARTNRNRNRFPGWGRYALSPNLRCLLGNCLVPVSASLKFPLHPYAGWPARAKSLNKIRLHAFWAPSWLLYSLWEVATQDAERLRKMCQRHLHLPLDLSGATPVPQMVF